MTRASRGSTVTGVGHINRGVGVPVTGGILNGSVCVLVTEYRLYVTGDGSLEGLSSHFFEYTVSNMKNKGGCHDYFQKCCIVYCTTGVGGCPESHFAVF